MYVLIVTRRGIVIGVFEGNNQYRLKMHAERLDGVALTWQDYLSHVGAHSRHDEERTYTVHLATHV